MSANTESSGDPYHLGNLISIHSNAGVITGRIIYRDEFKFRVMPQEYSDRAVEFLMNETQDDIDERYDVTYVGLLEEVTTERFIDMIGVQPGEVLEFFTLEGDTAAPSGTVEQLLPKKDAVKLQDGRVIKFAGRGPPDPIAVVRVLSEITAHAEEPTAEPVVPTAPKRRLADIMALLSDVFPASSLEMVPSAELSYPDSMQREDMFQDMLILDKGRRKQDKQPSKRTLRKIEQNVDLLMALKNRISAQDGSGRITGFAPYTIHTLKDAVDTLGQLSIAIPVVSGARVLNLDKEETESAFRPTDVYPQLIETIENKSEEIAKQYEEGSLPDSIGKHFDSFMQDLLVRGQSTLHSTTPITAKDQFKEDQDVIRTAPIDKSVQGLSSGLPGLDLKVPSSLAFLVDNIGNRTLRLLTKDVHLHHRSGLQQIIAPADPAQVVSYMMLPAKAGLVLRPNIRNSSNLITQIESADLLNGDDIPTVDKTLKDLFTPDSGSPLHVWTLSKHEANTVEVAPWLSSVIKYIIHPSDGLGPSSPQIIQLLDTVGLISSELDLSQEVTHIIKQFVANSQQSWQTLLIAIRERVAKLLENTGYSFQDTTHDSALWSAVRENENLKELMGQIMERYPNISESSTLLTAMLLSVAQGDVAPIVWQEIRKLNSGTTSEQDNDSLVTTMQNSITYEFRKQLLSALEKKALVGVPEINPCIHTEKLEAIRNVEDVVDRAKLLSQFITEFQGGRIGDWMTCVLCTEKCVCFHEIMELEALSQPSRLVTITKQILVTYGGDRYEGQIVCRNCGQGLQEIEFDEHVEFDDSGKPVIQNAVLTDEQMEDARGEDSVVDALRQELAPKVQFATADQQAIGEILQTIVERAGLIISPEITRTIVEYTDGFANIMMPSRQQYDTLRTTQMRSKTAVIPTFDESKGVLFVVGLTALIAIYLQAANPPIQVQITVPYCKFSRNGYPLDPTASPSDLTTPSALLYISCCVASLDKPMYPWNILPWKNVDKMQSRIKKVVEGVFGPLNIMLGKVAAKSLPFSASIGQMLETVRSDKVAQKERALVSKTDQLPVGFRPYPSLPQTIEHPTAERTTTSAAWIQQEVNAVIEDLHNTAIQNIQDSGVDASKSAYCCITSIHEINTKDTIETIKSSSCIDKTSKLWSKVSPIFIEPVSARLDEGVMFKLFLRYCYSGPQIGFKHEIDVGYTCRQCGFVLGAPITINDFGSTAEFYEAQQQIIQKNNITVNQEIFNKLSDIVRQRGIINTQPIDLEAMESNGLVNLIEAGQSQFTQILANLLPSLLLKGRENTDAIDSGLAWEPMSEYMDYLLQQIKEAIKFDPRKSHPVFSILDSLLEDPWNEGPMAIIEYWCSKAKAAGTEFEVVEVYGPNWLGLAQKHLTMLNTMVRDNARWYGGEITTEMRPILSGISDTISPYLRVWNSSVRSNHLSTAEARMLLRTIVLQGWWAGLDTNGDLYAGVSKDKQKVMKGIALWTQSLMIHAKQQFIRYSEETVKRVLQDRAALERATIVAEFDNIKDDDQRASSLLLKQKGIGRWGQGQNLQTYNPDTFEFERSQRIRMGLDGTINAGQQAQIVIGQEVNTAPEDGYDANQAEDGADY